MSRRIKLGIASIVAVIAAFAAFMAFSGTPSQPASTATPISALDVTPSTYDVDTVGLAVSDGSRLMITRHFMGKDQQVNVPTVRVEGNPTREMVCVAANVVGLYGSDNPTADAQRIQEQCGQFNADATAGNWLSCADDLDVLLDVIDADAPYHHQPLVRDLTNSQGMTLCGNLAGLPQERALGYADEPWRPIAAS